MKTSLTKVWKQDMAYYIREAVDPSLDEDDNFNNICEYDNEFVDPSALEAEDVIELGGSTKLAKRLVEQYDDLSSEKQNEVWNKVEELIKDYGQMLMDEEEDWIRRKIRRTIKEKNA